MAGLLASLGIVYVFIDGWLNNRSPTEQAVVWAVGGVLTAYSLLRLIPYRYERRIAQFGGFAAFACLFSAAYWFVGDDPPSHLPHPLESVPEIRQFAVPHEVVDAASDVVDRISDLSATPEQNTLSAEAGSSIEGRVVAISDGDTLTLLVGRTQFKIRLAEVDTPESGQPWGRRARQALADKVHREVVRIDVTDRDRYGRLVGKVWLGERDINRELVREGHAWVYRRYMEDRSLLRDERDAKRKGVGLWALEDPVEPWEWRAGRR